jgi:hypothetical protein
MTIGDEEFWVSVHERMPYDLDYEPILDAFGNPEFMFDALRRDAETSEDAYDAEDLEPAMPDNGDFEAPFFNEDDEEPASSTGFDEFFKQLETNRSEAEREGWVDEDTLRERSETPTDL